MNISAMNGGNGVTKSNELRHLNELQSNQFKSYSIKLFQVN